jgi:hypoxia-inducible factor 1 alpha
VLKDEPDDLTHLAPTAGDACISIDETTPFFSDMFDDFIIPDHYNTLLSDEINSLDASGAGNKINSIIKQQNSNNNNNSNSNNNNNNNSASNNNNNNSSTNNNNNNYRSNSNNCSNYNNKSCENNNGSSDPFINYRDDSCDINNSPHLLSPGLSKVIILCFF